MMTKIKCCICYLHVACIMHAGSWFCYKSILKVSHTPLHKEGKKIDYQNDEKMNRLAISL